MNVKHMQSFFISAGKYACYALCIIDIARKIVEKRGGNINHLDYLICLLRGIDKGYITFNFNNYDAFENFTVVQPELFLEYMTGEAINLRKDTADYKALHNEYVVEFWALNDANNEKNLGHFVLSGENTLQKSNTIANGKRYSTRVFTLV